MILGNGGMIYSVGTSYLLVLSRESMGMGVAGIIITDHGLDHSLRLAPVRNSQSKKNDDLG